MIIYQSSKDSYKNSVTAHTTSSKKKRVKGATSKRSLKSGNIKFLNKLGLKVKKKKNKKLKSKK